MQAVEAKKDLSASASRELLVRAFDHAAASLDALPTRAPFPSAQALNGLRGFDEPWPQNGASAEAILEQLQRLGAPATVATTGGRYFGFVMGGCLPVALAATCF